jgi:hypothetical protein
METHRVVAAIIILCALVILPDSLAASLASRKTTGSEAELGSVAIELLRRSPNLIEAKFSRTTTVLSDDCEVARANDASSPCIVLNILVSTPDRIARVCYSIILELENYCGQGSHDSRGTKLCEAHRRGGISLNFTDSAAKKQVLKSVTTR